ncbi:alpha/beta hydrolase [Novipirellula maiorica]|uniref:alpha/beta hydrolase n=1 Tax=Novipirellula maiorica TaxID=1265734 RepID=UPI001360B0BA|nr:alpha/beta hydrolase [Rhodopirellula maiorica]
MASPCSFAADAVVVDAIDSASVKSSLLSSASVLVDSVPSDSVLIETPLTADIADSSSIEESLEQDRIWLVSTRRISRSVCCADFEQPQFSVSRLSPNGCQTPSSMDEYLGELLPGRPTVVYVHGYRFTSTEAIRRGLRIHREIACRRSTGPIDWVIWSWPSAKEKFISHDIREKAKFTDTQGLYLAWMLKQHLRSGVPSTLIGYSFGGRVVTGSLHALAGGSLGGRSLPCEPVVDARIDVGLVAPAIENDWLAPHDYHALATSNMDHLLLLYNQKDSVLKRYWLLDKVRGAMAIGFGRLQSFAPRADGSRIWLRARECSSWIGHTHDELDYYECPCRAGSEMAQLVEDAWVHH